jgi:hypothetical protein
MADQVSERLVGTIDSFNEVWVRPVCWNEGQFDDRSVLLRDGWAMERDKWTVNLLALIQTWLRYPEDGPSATTEDATPSWEQVIAQFEKNMRHSAEVVEMEILKASAPGDEEP